MSQSSLPPSLSHNLKVANVVELLIVFNQRLNIINDSTLWGQFLIKVDCWIKRSKTSNAQWLAHSITQVVVIFTTGLKWSVHNGNLKILLWWTTLQSNTEFLWSKWYQCLVQFKEGGFEQFNACGVHSSLMWSLKSKPYLAIGGRPRCYSDYTDAAQLKMTWFAHMNVVI